MKFKDWMKGTCKFLAMTMALSAFAACSSPADGESSSKAAGGTGTDNAGTMTESTSQEGGTAGSGQKYAEHMEVIIDNTQIAAINPIGSGGPGSATGWVYKMVYDTLVVWSPDGDYLPGLATSWESEDWKTITFHLRDDVYFSNGEKFTSADVVFTIESALENPGSVAGGAMVVCGSRGSG